MLNLQQWIKFSSSTRIYANPTWPKLWLVFYLQGKSPELIFRRNSAGTCMPDRGSELSSTELGTNLPLKQRWNLTPTPAYPTEDLSCLQRSWELIFRRNSRWNLTPTSACPIAVLSIFNNPENQRSMCILIGNELF